MTGCRRLQGLRAGIHGERGRLGDRATRLEILAIAGFCQTRATRLTAGQLASGL